MNIETEAIHAGHHIDGATGALVPPIHLSTTFEREADGSFPHGYNYSRDSNPNREELQARLKALEGGADCAAFSSGSAATLAVMQSLSVGDHLIVSQDIYYGIRVMAMEIFGRWGLQVTFADMTDPATVKAAVRPNTRLILIETPSNPQIKLTDIARIADIAHQGGALLACDNTILTPILQRPFDFGADLVIHATTKYLSGHHDVTSGAVITREVTPFWEKLLQVQKIGGLVPSPFDCWLVLRGIQTLPYRLKAHSDNALQIARFLDSHPVVEKVLYPGLESHPQHELAKRQMMGFGGMMSFLVKGDQVRAMEVAAKVKVITRATSFGSPHSLIEHRASIEKGTSTPKNLLRLSVGLENVDDLIGDLAQALE
jgi:cystathionine gamma-synthase